MFSISYMSNIEGYKILSADGGKFKWDIYWLIHSPMSTTLVVENCAQFPYHGAVALKTAQNKEN